MRFVCFHCQGLDCSKALTNSSRVLIYFERWRSYYIHDVPCRISFRLALSGSILILEDILETQVLAFISCK